MKYMRVRSMCVFFRPRTYNYNACLLALEQRNPHKKNNRKIINTTYLPIGRRLIFIKKKEIVIVIVIVITLCVSIKFI